MGDKLYAHGDEAFARYCDQQLTVSDDELRAELGLTRHALRSASIRFPHPRRGEPITVESPLPADLQAYLAQRR